MIGSTIDRYRVVDKLGQGGMGVVYRARDTVLGRDVALKVLPPGKSTDDERRERFLREAKSASALNHPGIVAVHDILVVDDRDILVMELVEGQTLEALLASKRLGLGEALAIGIGVADALSRAHAAGIVHRDLKPSNIMINSDGVKVLDFGLAKLTESQFSDPESPTLALEETGLTRDYAILGTIGWMSPEQATGSSVDSRSDVFSFGVLMYEMLTGRHPFRRDTTIETIAAICEEEPAPLTSHVASLPPEAHRAVMRCLRKEPEKRWQSLSDLGAVLKDLKTDTESGRRVVAGRPPRRRSISVAVVLTAVVVLLAGALGLYLLRNERSAPAPLEIHRLTYDAGPSILPAISPDGNFVAFSSERAGEGGFDLWVRHIAQPEPVRLTTHPSDDWSPRFSPDGSRLVFTSNRDGGGIYVVNALGGGLRRVAGRGIFPRFSPDGLSIVYAENPGWTPDFLRRMYRIPAGGGIAEPFVPGWGVRPPPGSAGPVFSPDGKLVIFYGATIGRPRTYDWWVAPVEGGKPWSSGRSDAFPWMDVVEFPVIWFPGRLLFLSGTTIEGINLHSVEITDRGLLAGPPVALVSGPGITWMPTASRDGLIALSRFNWVIHLWELEIDPETGRPRGPETRTTDDAAPKFAFSLTEDGNLLGYSTFSGPRGTRRGELVILDRTTGKTQVPVTLRGAAATTSVHPRLSGDGTMVSWRGRLEGQSVSWVAPVADPVGRELCRSCSVVDFFSDGEHVLVDWGKRLSRVSLTTGEETTILEVDDRGLLDTDLSRDGRWLALQIGEPDGSVAIFVAPLAETPVSPDSWIEISRSDTWIGSPRWSTDGRFLYFISERDDFLCIWGRQLDPDTKTPAGEEFAVAHAHEPTMKRISFARHMWNIEVGGDRLVFNAGDLTGDVYTAQLDPLD